MKNKTILLLIGAGLITISFTFASVSEKTAEKSVEASSQAKNEPVGGFTSADQL